MTGASDLWAAGYTGQGVDVAVIDSGVVPVDGLRGRGKVVYGPDLHPRGQRPAAKNLDTYGHGTHMAGIIAGRDSAAAHGDRELVGLRRHGAGRPHRQHQGR